MCDHTYCYTPVVDHIRSLMHDGTVGDLLYFDSTRINLGAIQDDIDVLWDLAPHDLSILDAIIPGGLNAATVSAIGSDPLGLGRACLAYLTLHLPLGVLAHIHVNWLSPTKVRRTLIGGSRHTLVWDDLNPTQRLLVCDRGVTRDKLDTSSKERIAYRLGAVSSPNLPEEEALRNVIAAFGRGITSGHRTRTDGHAGVRVVRLLEAASHSMAKGGVPIMVGGDE
jgi:predicted dehydrogenase